MRDESEENKNRDKGKYVRLENSNHDEKSGQERSREMIRKIEKLRNYSYLFLMAMIHMGGLFELIGILISTDLKRKKR